MSDPRAEVLEAGPRIESKPAPGVLPRERFSCWSHAAGAVAAVPASVLLLMAARTEAWLSLVSVVYGLGATFMFSASALYHARKRDEDEITFWRRLDHSAVFVMIAGTFTPICFVHLSAPWFFGIVGAQWTLVVLGVSFKLFFLGGPRWLTAAIYLAMGWMALVPLVELGRVMSLTDLFFLGAGGAAYTIGALIYVLKKPDPWPFAVGFHGLFHLWVLAGAFFHFLVVHSAIVSAA